MKVITILTAILLYAATTFAHGYWIELEGPHKVKQPVTIKLFFGEFGTSERSSGKALDRMNEISVFVSLNGKKFPVAMQQLPTHWEGKFIPETEGRYTIIGINEEREVQDWTKHNLGITRPVQYLKAVYQVGTTVNPSLLTSLLDVVVTPNKSGYAVQLFKNKSAFSSAKLVVTDTSGKEKEIILDKEGKANFELKNPGLHVLDIEWIDKTPGRFKEKDYASIRYKLDYTLYNP